MNDRLKIRYRLEDLAHLNQRAAKQANIAERLDMLIAFSGRMRVILASPSPEAAQRVLQRMGRMTDHAT